MPRSTVEVLYVTDKHAHVGDREITLEAMTLIERRWPGLWTLAVVSTPPFHHYPANLAGRYVLEVRPLIPSPNAVLASKRYAFSQGDQDAEETGSLALYIPRSRLSL